MKNSQLYKGSLNTIIMKLLEENGKMYGYEITQKVKAITQGELNITEGALYPALHKLEAEGLLDVEIEKVDRERHSECTRAHAEQPPREFRYLHRSPSFLTMHFRPAEPRSTGRAALHA